MYMSEENGLNMEGLRDFYSHEQLEYLLQAYIGKANPFEPCGLLLSHPPPTTSHLPSPTSTSDLLASSAATLFALISPSSLSP